MSDEKGYASKKRQTDGAGADKGPDAIKTTSTVETRAGSAVIDHVSGGAVAIIVTKLKQRYVPYRCDQSPVVAVLAQVDGISICNDQHKPQDKHKTKSADGKKEDRFG